MDWQTATLSSAMGPGFMGLVRMAPDKRDADAINASLAKTTKLVAMLDAHLAGRDYVAGAAYGMADIVLAPIMHRWFNMPCARAAAPNAERWYATLMQRAACIRVLTLPLT